LTVFNHWVKNWLNPKETHMKFLAMTLATLLTSAAFAQIPDASALKAQATQQATALQEKATVNLNTASPEDLAKLPGIGPVRAKAIIDARPYHDVTDLKKVKGIGDGTIAKLKGLVTTK
jgi:competence protein ComEA